MTRPALHRARRAPAQPAAELARIAVGERLRLETGRRGRRATLCVEHCVLLSGIGVFVSGWLLDPAHGLGSLRVCLDEDDEGRRLVPELSRPEVVEAEKRELRRSQRGAAEDLRPGFWELVPAALEDGTERLRLVATPASGASHDLTLAPSEDARAILGFVQVSGLYAVASHLPRSSAALPPNWREALFRLAWLLPEGSVEVATLEAYLERGEPLALAELGVSFESSRTDAALPPPETVRELRASGLFDERHYRASYPDVVSAGSDPLLHFLTLGHREGRNPAPGFVTTYYRSKYLGGDRKANPLVHYYETGSHRGHHTAPGAHDFDEDVYAQVRHWAAPGDGAEDFDPSLAAGRPPRARVFAFYLPQFHAIAENDRWWGKGFTEWHNLMRAMPRFAGHYQPRIPRDLGFYDLGDQQVLRRQAELARGAGIEGFCFYYYRFNGRRVLERPTDRFLADPSIDLPFCLIWANENWTRRWDGAEDEVLLRQEYDRGDDDGLIDDLQRHFDDPRYLRIGGRPILFVYRSDVIPNARRTLERWRELWSRRHGEAPLIFCAQTFETRDPRPLGADGAVEFPPHKVAELRAPINQTVRVLDPSFTGHVYDYETIAIGGEREPYPDFPLIKGVVPSWDNDARRQGGGVVLRGSTPQRYERWLRRAIEVAERHPVLDQKLVFVNAWNEWAEGAYLEPDVHYGAAYLNATARAACGQAATSRGLE